MSKSGKAKTKPKQSGGQINHDREMVDFFRQQIEDAERAKNEPADNLVWVPAPVVRWTRGSYGALILAQMIYWLGPRRDGHRSRAYNGYWEASQRQILRQLGLGRRQAQRAVDRGVSLGLLRRESRGTLPPRLYPTKKLLKRLRQEGFELERATAAEEPAELAAGFAAFDEVAKPVKNDQQGKCSKPIRRKRVSGTAIRPPLVPKFGTMAELLVWSHIDWEIWRAERDQREDDPPKWAHVRDGKHFWLRRSIPSIARYTGLTPRQVRYAIRSLGQARRLVVQRKWVAAREVLHIRLRD